MIYIKETILVLYFAFMGKYNLTNNLTNDIILDYLTNRICSVF